jgi:hypothetical protein
MCMVKRKYKEKELKINKKVKTRPLYGYNNATEGT